MILLSVFYLVFSSLTSVAQSRKNLRLPLIPGFYILKGDFHMHTPFSDGSVWPADRVHEAWRDGLDIIAITDHLEYNPNKTDVSTDLNRPYEIAKPVADQYGIILIKAAEITRSMPPGHFNAYFLDDVNELKQEKIEDAFKAAQKQGAFFVWNHPGWKAQQPDTTMWFPAHTEFYEKGWLQGIEVFNEREYYPEAHLWANEKKLTQFANSDIHGPVDFSYDITKNQRRPITLVFVRKTDVEGIREAFLNQRTVALFNDTLTGNEKILNPLVSNCLKFPSNILSVNKRKEINIVIENISDLRFQLRICGSNEQNNTDIRLEDNASVCYKFSPQNLKTGLNKHKLNFCVLNALTEPQKPLEIEFTVNSFYMPDPELIPAEGKNTWKFKSIDTINNISFHYTTNGSIPTPESPGSESVFNAADSIKIKLSAFYNNVQIGEEFNGTYYLHQGIGAKMKLKNPASQKYGIESFLLNGIRGSQAYSDGRWVAFEKNDFEILIENTGYINLTSIELGFLQNIDSWIFPPEILKIYTSADGKEFIEYGEVKYANPNKNSKKEIVNSIISKKAKDVKYIKVFARNTGICPDWHNGKGKPAWLFVDEIIIR